MMTLDAYRKAFDYPSAFEDWWGDVAHHIADVVGDEQTRWMHSVLKHHWHESPTAWDIVDDRWNDERRMAGER